jgi:hypothetical protein
MRFQIILRAIANPSARRLRSLLGTAGHGHKIDLHPARARVAWRTDDGVLDRLVRFIDFSLAQANQRQCLEIDVGGVVEGDFQLRVRTVGVDADRLGRRLKRIVDVALLEELL